MQNIVSTCDIPPQNRLEFWQSQVGSVLTHLECTSAVEDRFFGTMKVLPSTPSSLFEIDTAQHTIARATPKLTQVGEEQIFVCVQIAGTATVEQDSREVVLGVGDMTLLDTSRRFLADFPHEMSQLVLQVPRSLFRKHVSALERLTATLVPAESALGRITGEFLVSFARDFEYFSPAISQRLNSQALDMVVMAFMSALDASDVKSSATRSILAYRGRAFIEENLRNAGLSPSAVAEHLGISTRYLSIVFAGDGQSVERFIRERRLQKCAQDLRDRSQFIRPIGDIAYGWGFNNLSHFSQCFKTAFGQTPREYRQQALAVPFPAS